MAKMWIKAAIKRPGALRRKLKAKEGEPIPAAELEAATESKNPRTRRQAALAQTLRGMARGRAAKRRYA